MKQDAASVGRHLRTLSDEALGELDPATMTPEGQEALRAEISRRETPEYQQEKNEEERQLREREETEEELRRQRSAIGPTRAPQFSLFKHEDYWPFMFGLFVFGGFSLVPVIWSRFGSGTYWETLPGALLGCGVFAYSLGRHGEFMIGRFILAMGLAYFLVFHIHAVHGAGLGVPGGILGLLVMSASGWLGIGLSRWTGFSFGGFDLTDRRSSAGSGGTRVSELEAIYRDSDEADLLKIAKSDATGEWTEEAVVAARNVLSRRRREAGDQAID